jgi:hypothetical protein
MAYSGLIVSGEHQVMPIESHHQAMRSGQSPAKLTLVSVKFGSPALLTRNIALVRHFNPKTDFEWLVVNNDFDPSFSVKGVRVLAGIPKPNAPDKGSTHHALALNLALEAVQTRYVLLLDHDFFVLRPNWILDTLEHLHQQNLAVLASQWHPRWSYQPQRQPSVHFLLLDLQQISKAQLDFRPDFSGNRFDSFISSPRLPLPKSLRTLLQTGAYRDTGWRLLEQTQGFKVECLELGLDLPSLEQNAPWLHRLAQRLLPQRWSPLPKNMTGYGAKHFLPPEAQAQGWEEFFWRGVPFGLHLRSVGNGLRKVSEMDLLEQVLSADNSITPKAYT